MNRRKFFLTVWLFFILTGLTTYASINATYVFSNGSIVNNIFYDRYNSTISTYKYGSDSYMDSSPTTENIMMVICHPNITPGKQVDLRYYTESYNYTASVLNYHVEVVSVTNTTTSNCTTVDVDLSSRTALYPGFVVPVLSDPSVPNSTQILPRLKIPFNGTFQIGVKIDAPPKVYYFSIPKVYDQNGKAIGRKESLLLTSFIDTNNISLTEEKLKPGQRISYGGNLIGNEKVIVNGITSLEIKVYNPCQPLNTSGYYIMNNSAFEQNASCVKINETSDVVLNFGTELIDGDGQANGSYAKGSCPVVIQNSHNVTLESMRTQEYYYGVCIFNSSVDIIGQTSVFHQNGAYIDNHSNVKFIEVNFDFNNVSDIIANGSSNVELVNVNFTSAALYSSFRDSTIRSVLVPPDPPNITGIRDIGQYIEYSSSSRDAWAIIKFFYTYPIPNGVAAENVSIFEYNGTRVQLSLSVINTTTNTTGNTTTNTTNYSGTHTWENGKWKQVFTLISPSQQLIISPNMSNFSVFAPFSLEDEPDPEPEPEPEPNPVPDVGPSGGGGGGGSGSGSPSQVVSQIEAPIYPEAISLDLNIQDNITLMQGEAGEVYFNITNIGNFTALNITLKPEVPAGWETADYSIDELMPAEFLEDFLQIATWEKEAPGEYLIDVGVTVDTEFGTAEVVRDFFKVFVVPRSNLSRMRVIEYPPVIEMSPYSNLNVSFLVENIGDMALSNVTIKYDMVECVDAITGSNNILFGEKKHISYSFQSSGPGICDYNLKFISDDKLVGFVPVTFIIRQPRSLARDFRFYLLLLILIFWTILTFYVARRDRRKKEE